MVTKQRLQKLKALHEEVKDLELRIKENRFKPTEEVADTVKDYRTGFGKTIVIRGYGDTSWARLKEKYLDSMARLNHEIRELEDFISSIEDPEMRKILRMRYEDGMTHQQIGDKLCLTRAAIEKRERTFWEKVEK